MALAQIQPEASPPQNTGPRVMVYIGHDDPSRGDSHGFKGIGARMAQKLGGQFHYLENKHLQEMYPGETDPMALYVRDHGKPDILFSRFGDFGGMMTSITPLMMVDSINEDLSAVLLGEKSLVAHHLTEEVLSEQGKQFRENYKDITTPLVAVMLVNIRDVETFAQKMVSKCAAYDEVTVFLCTSRRTYEDNYLQVKNRLNTLAEEHGLAGRMRVEGYSFQDSLRRDGAFNPYIGLINEADHIVVAGESLSMISEPLAIGKPTMVYEAGYTHNKLKKKGLVIDFNASAADTRFETPHVAPINITEDITNKLIDRFNEAVRASKPGLSGFVFRSVKKFKEIFSL